MRVQKVLTVLRERKAAYEKTITHLKKRVQSLSTKLDVVPHFAGPTVMMSGSSAASDTMKEIREEEFKLDDITAAVFAIEEQLAPQNDIPISNAVIQSTINDLPDVAKLRMEIQESQGKLAQIELMHAQGRDSNYYIKAGGQGTAARASIGRTPGTLGRCGEGARAGSEPT